MDEFKNDAEAKTYFETLSADKQLRHNVRAHRELERLKAWKKSVLTKMGPVKDALTEEMNEVMADIPDDTIVQVGDKYLSWQTQTRVSALNEDNVSKTIGALSTASKNNREATIAGLNIAKMLQDRERNRRKKEAAAEKKRVREEKKRKRDEKK
jgi:hypothetical protein